MDNIFLRQVRKAVNSLDNISDNQLEQIMKASSDLLDECKQVILKDKAIGKKHLIANYLAIEKEFENYFDWKIKHYTDQLEQDWKEEYTAKYYAAKSIWDETSGILPGFDQLSKTYFDSPIQILIEHTSIEKVFSTFGDRATNLAKKVFYDYKNRLANKGPDVIERTLFEILKGHLSELIHEKQVGTKATFETTFNRIISEFEVELTNAEHSYSEKRPTQKDNEYGSLDAPGRKDNENFLNWIYPKNRIYIEFLKEYFGMAESEKPTETPQTESKPFDFTTLTSVLTEAFKKLDKLTDKGAFIKDGRYITSVYDALRKRHYLFEPSYGDGVEPFRNAFLDYFDATFSRKTTLRTLGKPLTGKFKEFYKDLIAVIPEKNSS